MREKKKVPRINADTACLMIQILMRAMILAFEMFDDAREGSFIIQKSLLPGYCNFTNARERLIWQLKKKACKRRKSFMRVLKYL